MPKPYPDPTGINTSFSVIEYANTVTGGWVGPLFILASSAILFIILKQLQYRTSDSLLVSFFITFVLGSLMWAVGLIAGKIIVLVLLLMISSGIWSYLDE